MALVVAVSLPMCLIGVVRTVMVEVHQAAPAAQALGFDKGEPYGFDGWYVGRREGRKVGLAAVHIRQYELIRFRRFVEAGQVAVWVDHAPPRSPILSVYGKVLGDSLPADEVEAMERWMASNEEEVMLVDAAEVDFADAGAALVLTWRGASPDAGRAEAWIDKLVPLARELER